MSVLLVGMHGDPRAALSRALARAGCPVSSAVGLSEAVERLAKEPFDAVVLASTPEQDAAGELRRLREAAPTAYLVALVHGPGTEEEAGAMAAGASDVVAGPVDPDALAAHLSRIGTGQPRLSPEAGGEQGFLVGRSPALSRVREVLARFAASDAPVLITGETGTGKELVWRAIHELSARAARPLVAINCAAFPETLLEAELFGHERGAFTGAVKRRDGRFKAADGGTLFLDEVAEIPLPSQAKLLRVLQDRSFEPLGTNQTVSVDVRILAATNRDLKECVSQGRFRADLYYRLKILELNLPPLRERPGDIRLLAEHFLRRYAPPGHRLRLTSRAMSILAGHSFPGNVRELESAIRHAIALSPGDYIDASDLPPDLIAAVGGVALPPITGPAEVRPLDQVVEEFERSYLKAALVRTGGRKAEAAQLLGISRKSFWSKLRRPEQPPPLEQTGEQTGEHSTETPLPPLPGAPTAWPAKT